MKNPLTNKHIFYHITDKTRVNSILKKGLIINSKPLWYKNPVPFISISTIPFYDYMIDTYKVTPNPMLIEINLKGFGSDKEIDEWNNSEFCDLDWQIKMWRNIPSDRIKVKKITKVILKKADNLGKLWDKKFGKIKGNYVIFNPNGFKKANRHFFTNESTKQKYEEQK